MQVFVMLQVADYPGGMALIHGGHNRLVRVTLFMFFINLCCMYRICFADMVVFNVSYKYKTL